METVVLDVRGMIEEGNDPFETVVSAFDRLADGESFTLVAPFDPKPLIAFLTRRGASAELLQSERGDVRYRITSNPQRKAEEKICPHLRADGVLDLRNLPPPEPMVHFLEVFEKSAAGSSVVALLSRAPGHLIKMLEQRGFPVKLEEQEDGFVMTVTRP